MVYKTTNTITNQMNNASINSAMNPTSANYNSTSAYEVVGFDGETYTLNVTLASLAQGKDFSLPPITTKVNKANYYRDFLASGAPRFFNDVSGNPTLSAILAKSQVNVGDSWNIPVTTGNSSLGLTGELTLRFAEIQEITVPAGKYTVFRIEVSSSNLELHADPDYLNTVHLTIPENMSLQISGKTYLEQGTCRLIKSELAQETTSQPNGTGSTSVIYSEKILVEHIKP